MGPWLNERAAQQPAEAAGAREVGGGVVGGARAPQLSRGVGPTSR